MLQARSVAVVGASARPGSFGEQLVVQLRTGGFGGDLHLVNPRWREVGGLTCHPSLADLPGPLTWPSWASPTPRWRASSRRRPRRGRPPR
jgi:predicted CoA-binding protein